jgi:hypothetical protein
MKTRVAVIAHTLLAVMIALFVVTGIRQSFAEVQFNLDLHRLLISGTISKGDADYVVQHEADLKQTTGLTVWLNSVGGDVAAAMTIGRIIRHEEALVVTLDRCFSSCALIYIAGVTRLNDYDGLIGLHRPYLAADALSREAIERAAPLMLQRIKDYVREMGVSDAFYDAMVNTEVSDVRLYRGDEIYRLVPETDPTYDEIENAYEARRYGISVGEMRRRKSMVKQKCDPLFSGWDNRVRHARCEEAIYWGLDMATYERVTKKGFPECESSENEVKIYSATDIKKRRDLPFYIKQEVCIRDGMNKRAHGWAN